MSVALADAETGKATLQAGVTPELAAGWLGARDGDGVVLLCSARGIAVQFEQDGTH